MCRPRLHLLIHADSRKILAITRLYPILLILASPLLWNILPVILHAHTRPWRNELASIPLPKKASSYHSSHVNKWTRNTHHILFNSHILPTSRQTRGWTLVPYTCPPPFCYKIIHWQTCRQIKKYKKTYHQSTAVQKAVRRPVKTLLPSLVTHRVLFCFFIVYLWTTLA